MEIKKIDGVEETFEVGLNKYELERVFLAVRTAIPALTRSMDFDSITVAALLEVHNKIIPFLRDEEGQLNIGMMGGNNYENIINRLLGQQ